MINELKNYYKIVNTSELIRFIIGKIHRLTFEDGSLYLISKELGIGEIKQKEEKNDSEDIKISDIKISEIKEGMKNISFLEV